MVKNLLKYYWITWSSTSNDTNPVAYAPEDTPLAHELVRKVKEMIELPFELKLYSVNVNEEGIDKGTLGRNPLDYQPNSLSWPLMSGKMQKIINSELRGTEKIKWLKVTVNGIKDSYIYYVPVFCTKLDTLDIDKTVFVPNTDHIIKPVFKEEKIMDYAMFHGHNLFWQISSEIYVNQAIRQKLIKEGITGIQFEKVI